MSWADALDRVNNECHGSSPSTASTKKSVRKIFEFADRAGLNSSAVDGLSASALREIIPLARRCVLRGDAQGLRDLFDLARGKTVVEVRVLLHGHEMEVIPVVVDSSGPVELYVVTFVKHQFDRACHSLARTYKMELV